MMKYLNLGCGTRFHPNWVNIDVTSSSPMVMAHDLRRGIPFSDRTFDVTYHSHLLEHFSSQEGLELIKECFRVLKPHGIIRVVVPDLEQIAISYLQTLNMVLQNDDIWEHNYDWMILELYDQTVREYPGGVMLEFLKQDPLPNEDFVFYRLGYEARQIVQEIRSKRSKEKMQSIHGSNLFRRILGFLWSSKAKVAERILGYENYQAFRVARFRQKGEIHKWMYDRFSLARLLKRAGFESPIRTSATESNIDDWISFNLDTQSDGAVYKPDSLFMEAVKPLEHSM
jgi:SAM-dependent methyltransferase